MYVCSYHIVFSILPLFRDMTRRVSKQNIWFGRSQNQLRYWIALAIVLFGAMFSLHTPAIAEIVAPIGIPTGFRVNIGVFAPLVVVPAALAGYLTEGVLVSYLLAAGLTFGAFLPSALFDTPDFPVRLIPVLQTAFLLTIVVGGVGFLIGVGVRQLVVRRTAE